MTCDLDVMTEVRKELRESQNQRDKRIEDLWRTLNPAKAAALDLRALQRGLGKIDHRKGPRSWVFGGLLTRGGDDVALANADDMLRKIMDAADTNRDGKISYQGELPTGLPPRARRGVGAGPADIWR